MVSRLTIKSILTNYAIRCNSGIRGGGGGERRRSGLDPPPLPFLGMKMYLCPQVRNADFVKIV